MRVTIPIDLSTQSSIPLALFFNSRRVSPLLNQSLVLNSGSLPNRHMMCVMFKTLPVPIPTSQTSQTSQKCCFTQHDEKAPMFSEKLKYSGFVKETCPSTVKD
jgi:hypothetical protein